MIDAMTLSLGDFNQDGRQDLYHTNTWFGGVWVGIQTSVQQESGHFTEESAEHNGLRPVLLGIAWMDVDNDTDRPVRANTTDRTLWIELLWENQVETDMNLVKRAVPKRLAKTWGRLPQPHGWPRGLNQTWVDFVGTTWQPQGTHLMNGVSATVIPA